MAAAKATEIKALSRRQGHGRACKERRRLRRQAARRDPRRVQGGQRKGGLRVPGRLVQERGLQGPHDDRPRRRDRRPLQADQEGLQGRERREVPHGHAPDDDPRDLRKAQGQVPPALRGRVRVHAQEGDRLQDRLGPHGELLARLLQVCPQQRPGRRRGPEGRADRQQAPGHGHGHPPPRHDRPQRMEADLRGVREHRQEDDRAGPHRGLQGRRRACALLLQRDAPLPRPRRRLPPEPGLPEEGRHRPLLPHHRDALRPGGAVQGPLRPLRQPSQGHPSHDVQEPRRGLLRPLARHVTLVNLLLVLWP
ncbi:Alpha-7.1 giardin [Giardia lamblia P15]|uniref:Alpha-7.1 giardin n=1 Tax=Giardia intestinalis (strain P15) TaxID=658858 RepID=E1EVN2_GIAIA|nr:Alpha-7.1 giardin [Giardia lamblia P15]